MDENAASTTQPPTAGLSPATAGSSSAAGISLPAAPEDAVTLQLRMMKAWLDESLIHASKASALQRELVLKDLDI